MWCQGENGSDQPRFWLLTVSNPTIIVAVLQGLATRYVAPRLNNSGKGRVWSQ